MFKYEILKSLSVVESTLIEESRELANLMHKQNISYDELIELRMYFAKERPELYKGLFDMVEEHLLKINLNKN